MSKWLATLGATSLAMAVSSGAMATNSDTVPEFGNVVVASLSGFEEVPSVSTNAEGQFFAEILEDRLEYRLSYAGLESDATQAHIHFGRRGTNGGVSAFLCSNLNGPEGTQTCPITEGVITGTITAQEVVGPEDQGIAPGEFEELIRAILNEAAYANVHTVDHPAGEIRGQIR